MSNKKQNVVKIWDILGWIFGFALIPLFFFGLMSFINWIENPQLNLNKQVKSYKKALELCGEENVIEMRRDDKSFRKVFDCKDYKLLID